MSARSPGAAASRWASRRRQTKINVAIAAWDWGSYFDPAARAQGLAADHRRIIRRPDPRTAPAKSKATGLYMICTIEKHRAERAGYADALMLDWRGQIAEATGANIFFVKDGVLHTPLPDCFLDGITRRTVIGLAKKRGLEGDRARDHAGGAGRLLRVLHHRHGRRGDAGRRRSGRIKFAIGDITRNLMNDYAALVHHAKAGTAKVAAAG